jgi:hypothetical protein
MPAELKASVYQGEHELLRDVAVDIDEDGHDGIWGGSFQLNHPRQRFKVGGSYVMKLDDGRSGAIVIVDFDPSDASIDPWVPFRGSGPLR